MLHLVKVFHHHGGQLSVSLHVGGYEVVGVAPGVALRKREVGFACLAEELTFFY
ncbi:MAG: hypothetical protein LBL94_05330 [Prevotellaceae bacterium]|nr:hypothetical protein [Prevotellaceae bacterium]